MNTKIWYINGEGDEQKLDEAAKMLADGKVVAIPTETVYGLAASIYSDEAVKNIFNAKGRPQDNPLIVHVWGPEMVPQLVAKMPKGAKELMEAFWPGPLSIIMPKSDKVSYSVSAGLDTVAIRCPSNPVAHQLIKRSNHPLAAPSANLSGAPSPTTPRHVIADMDGLIDGIVCAGDCEIGVESTVVSLCGEVPVLCRPGAVSVEQLEQVLGKIQIADAVVHQLKPGERAISPGMKYKHYAPKTDVHIVKGTPQAYQDYVNAQKGEGVFALCFEEDIPYLQVPYVVWGSIDDDFSQTKRLFTALRELDEKGAKIAYAHCPKTSGVALSVYNRLLRSAAFQVIEL